MSYLVVSVMREEEHERAFTVDLDSGAQKSSRNG